MNRVTGRATRMRVVAVVLTTTAIAALWVARDARPGAAGPSDSPLPVPGIRLGPIREVPLGEHLVTRQNLSVVAFEGSTLFAVATVEGGHAVVAIDLRSGGVQQLTPGRSPQVQRAGFVLSLAASPTHVAWVEYPNGYNKGAAELHLLDRRSLREVVLDTDLRGIAPPDIVDGLLVWQKWLGNPKGVFGYDLESGRQFTITDTIQFQWLYLCSREWLIYVTNIPGGKWGNHAALRAHHIATGKDIGIGVLWYPQYPYTSNLGSQHACNGNNIAWISYRWSVSKPVLEHRLYDLTSRRTRMLELPIAFGAPSVQLSQDIVLDGLTAYSIRRDTRFAVEWPKEITHGGRQLLSGDTIAWIIDGGPGVSWRLYTATIERDR